MSTFAKTLAFEDKKKPKKNKKNKPMRVIRKGLRHLYPTSKPSLANLYKQPETQTPLPGFPVLAQPICPHPTAYFPGAQNILVTRLSPIPEPTYSPIFMALLLQPFPLTKVLAFLKL